MTPLWFPRFGLATRLAIQIIFISVTTLLVDWASQAIIPMPDIILMDREWLAAAVRDAWDEAEQTPAPLREAALEKLSSSAMLDFEISDRPRAETSDNHFEKIASLEKVLRQHLPSGVRLLISAEQPPFFDFDRSLDSVAVVVSKVPVRMVDEQEDYGKGDVLITPHLRIQAALSNGTWLNVQQSTDGSIFPRLARNFAAPAYFIVIILFISFRASRVLLKPLLQLAAAAERLGRERSITPIPEMHIPEYKAIADSFNEMQTRLKRFIDERTQMLAAISHDLNTPLTRLRLLAEDLSDRRQREQVLADIGEMEVMIRSSLAFARDDSRQEPSVSVDIASLLISLCDTVSDAGQSARYRGSDHASLSCRPSAMRRAIANLVDNGCKYGGQVVVDLEVVDKAVEIRITDQGPGIPEQDREKAFAPFQRLETSRNRQTGGTGLGLPIARDIIRSHGGDIALQNGREGGLTVTVRLPRPEQPALRRTA
ncbi:MAG: ATP-binding protein [Kiloniellaceae bacterium]